VVSAAPNLIRHSLVEPPLAAHTPSDASQHTLRVSGDVRAVTAAPRGGQTLH
jgi:hypothetical protein